MRCFDSLVLPLEVNSLRSGFRTLCPAFEHVLRGGYPTEDSTLRLDHRQSGLVKLRKVRCAAVRQHDAAEASVVCLPHRRIDTDLGGDTANQQRFDATVAQYQLKVGLAECALTGFVDNRLPGCRIKLRNDVVAGFASHKNPTHRASSPDPQRWIATLDLQARRVGQIRAMALARMDNRDPGLPCCRQYCPAGLPRRAQQRNVIAKGGTKPSRLKKIALHIDDEECSMVEFNRHRRRLRVKIGQHGRAPIPALSNRVLSKPAQQKWGQSRRLVAIRIEREETQNLNR